MRLFVFVFLMMLLSICLAQTTINIHNSCGGNSCGNDHYPVNPHPPQSSCEDPTFKFGSYFGKVGFFSQGFDRDLWLEIVKRTPELKGFISPLPYYTSQQFIDLGNKCVYDLITDYYPMYQYLRKSDSMYFVWKESKKYTYNILGSNMPRIVGNASSTFFCDNLFPTCSNGNRCGKGDFSLIANYSLTYNSPITLYYLKDEPLSADVRLFVINGLGAFGIGNITTIEYDSKPETAQSIALLMGTTNPRTKIYLFYNPYYNDNSCGIIVSAPFPFPINLFEFQPPSYSFGFPICPTNYKLKLLMDSAIQKIRDDFTICKLRVKYFKNCKFVHPLVELSDDICNSWSEFPVCNTTTLRREDDIAPFLLDSSRKPIY